MEEPENKKGPSLEEFSVLQEFEDVFQEILVDIMVVTGPCVTLTRIEYSWKKEETLKIWT